MIRVTALTLIVTKYRVNIGEFRLLNVWSAVGKG